MLHSNNSFKRIVCIFVRKKLVWLNMNKDNIFMINFYSKITLLVENFMDMFIL